MILQVRYSPDVSVIEEEALTSFPSSFESIRSTMADNVHVIVLVHGWLGISRLRLRAETNFSGSVYDLEEMASTILGYYKSFRNDELLRVYATPVNHESV